MLGRVSRFRRLEGHSVVVGGSPLRACPDFVPVCAPWRWLEECKAGGMGWGLADDTALVIRGPTGGGRKPGEMAPLDLK